MHSKSWANVGFQGPKRSAASPLLQAALALLIKNVARHCLRCRACNLMTGRAFRADRSGLPDRRFPASLAVLQHSVTRRQRVD